MKYLLFMLCLLTLACTKEPCEPADSEFPRIRWEFKFKIPSQNDKLIELTSTKVQDNLGSWSNTCSCHPVIGKIADLTGQHIVNSALEDWYMLIVENDIKKTTTITGSVNGQHYIIDISKSTITFCDGGQNLPITWNLDKKKY